MPLNASILHKKYSFIAFYSISRYIFSFSFQIYRFSIYYLPSVREILRETSCFFIFCSFHTIFIDFSHFSDQAAYFLLFIALFDFAVTFLLFYSFNVFFSLRHASLPLHLPGLPFSLFLRAILRFSQFSTLFILFLCFFHLLLPFFSSFSPFAASLACFFCFFVHPLLHLPLFSRFFPFLSSFLSFFLFFVYSAVSCPLFAIFQFFLHFFVSTYVTLPGSFFHVSHPSKCFT